MVETKILAALLNWALDRVPMGTGCTYCGWPQHGHTSECALGRARSWANRFDPKHRLDATDGISLLLPALPKKSS
jgi:hypothetical protein